MRDAKELYVGIGAVVHDDSVLLVRRDAPDIPEYDRKWELPGGKVEPGESPAEAIMREIYEETGYLVEFREKLPFNYVAELPLANPPLHVLVECGRCMLRDSTTSADAPTPSPQEKGSHRSEWFRFDELPYAQTLPGTNEFLTWLAHLSGHQIPTRAALYSIVLEHEKGLQYSVSIAFLPEEMEKEAPPFVVTLRYGKVLNRSVVKRLSYATMTEAIDSVRSRLRRRKRAGYYLVEIDENNPLRSWVQHLNVPVKGGYPALFESRRQLSAIAKLRSGASRYRAI